MSSTSFPALASTAGSATRSHAVAAASLAFDGGHGSAAQTARAPAVEEEGAVAFLRRVLANKTTLPERFVAIIQEFLQRIEELQKPAPRYRSQFEREYAELCASIDDADWFSAALTPQTKHTLARNRYRDVLPFERTRVKLSLAPPHDYINANFVDDTYIACCAPVPAAVRDFWRMVWEQNAAVVLMLTNFVERERIKADLYWDARGQAVDFGGGGVCAQLVREQADAVHGFLVRTFHVWRAANPEAPRVVLHVQLTTWPDHGVLRDFRVIAPMLELVNRFRDRAAAREPATAAPRVVVHCSAGIGRSGTFIAIDVVLKRLRDAFAAASVAEGEAALREALDVRALVHRLRSQRPGMVQTPEQYEMIYRYVAAVLTNRQPW